MRLHRLHVATLNEWDNQDFNMFLHEDEKILDFYSEQGQLFCFVATPKDLRSDFGDLNSEVETKRTYSVVEKRYELPKVGDNEDLKFIKIIPPRWALFEKINLEELGKQGMAGFNFGYPGIFQEAANMWKALALAEEKKNA